MTHLSASNDQEGHGVPGHSGLSGYSSSKRGLALVDEIGDSEMVFGEISREFAIDYLAFTLRLGKTSEKPNQVISPSGDRTAPERNFRPAGKRLNRLIHAVGLDDRSALLTVVLYSAVYGLTNIRPFTVPVDG
ncbi:hypothetical protein ANN_04753 [Periplaneta americana]|uniref:Uncharacterized protein n=1 Tax=Periplaneta americana TaxID=6978 RepID=A0ABQ8TAY9_PERAM|nr:hypothetical protein ANN_04753 [Periplaneta americana]